MKSRLWALAVSATSMVMMFPVSGPVGVAAEDSLSPAPVPASVGFRFAESGGWAEQGLARARVRNEIVDGSVYVDDTGIEVTSTQIENFLARHHSPLTPYSGDIIRAANRHRLDPRLVVAIAGVESTFGKFCAGHNAWGWDGGRARWGSWEEAIDSYTGLLAVNYPNWRHIKKIAPIYNPNTPDAWGTKVAFLMNSVAAER